MGKHTFVGRIDNGMRARNEPDLLRPLQGPRSMTFKDRILIEHAPRDQTLGKTSFVVERLSTIPEVKAFKHRDILTVQLQKIFAPGTVLLGFGMSNVFLAKVMDHTAGQSERDNATDNDDDSHLDPVARFDAKSLYREPSKILRNKSGNDQTGFYIVPNLTSDEVEHIQAVAESEVGNSYKTCCYAVSNILQRAGFRVRDCMSYDPSSIWEGDIRRTWPTDLLEAIIKRGLRYNGRDVDFMVVSTVKEDLPDYITRVRKAQRTPLTRFLRAKIMPVREAERVRRVKHAAEVQMDDKYYRQKETRNSKSEEPSRANPERFFSVEVSNPSDFGLIMRKMWGPHSVFRLNLNEADTGLVQQLFHENLTPFPNTANFVTKLKKHILMSPFVVRHIIAHHQAGYASKGTFTSDNIMELIPADKRFNFVLTSKTLAITPVVPGAAGWLLSKHLILARGCEAPDEVKMAGEITLKLCELVPPHLSAHPDRGPTVRQHVINCSNESGTYRPGSHQMHAMEAFLERLFPGYSIDLTFVGRVF